MTSNFLDELPPNIREIALRVNLRTPLDVLNTTKSRILNEFAASKRLSAVVSSCTPDDVRKLKEAAAKIVAADQALTADALLQTPHNSKWSRITFGCKALDQCTGGGVLTRGITEFVGDAGVGKTQLLLQLSLCVQLPKELGGLNKGVAYICTKDAFPTKRLAEITKTFAKRFPEHNINYMGNIYIEQLYEAPELLKCVSQRLDKLLQTVGIGLIVVDSVAAIFRLYTDFKERARDMRKMANALLRYVDKYECAVICVNQMTASMNGLPSVPCLGLSWEHLGRTRIRIYKVPKQLTHQAQLLTVRKLEVMYSPDTPNEFAEFLITAAGVVDVPT